MDLSGGHLVARTLRHAGVGHIFTLCGGHILPIYDGCITEGFAGRVLRQRGPGPGRVSMDRSGVDGDMTRPLATRPLTTRPLTTRPLTLPSPP
ncbi:MAG: thiamine pyrophosphate-binding protein, partial [Candidatus Rokuibacteriota bacterium]